MVFPEIQVSQWGFFDSRIKFPRVIVTDPRPISEYEIELYTEDQQGISYLNGNPIALKEGTMICAKPGSTRYSRLHFKCLHIHIQTQDPQLREMLDKVPDSFQVTDLAAFTECFRKILSLDMGAFPSQRLLMQGYVCRLLYLLIEECRSGNHADYHHRRTVLAAEEHIRNHLAEDLSLDALATRANLSPVYFHKLFRAHTHTTPAQYVLTTRIAAAKTMLKTGELSIGEIASRCGFSSQSYFNYKFKEVTGETPLQYRNTRLSRLKL